jgi:hypothetical protein
VLASASDRFLSNPCHFIVHHNHPNIQPYVSDASESVVQQTSLKVINEESLEERRRNFEQKREGRKVIRKGE